MISDVLHEAVEQVREYLVEPAFRDAYEGETRKQIEGLVAEMDRVRALLDAVPADVMYRTG